MCDDCSVCECGGMRCAALAAGDSAAGGVQTSDSNAARQWGEDNDSSMHTKRESLD